MTIKIIAKDKFYVPMKYVDPDKLRNLYITDVFNEKMCAPCEYKPERPCEVCTSCKGYIGRYKLYSEKEKNGKTYIGLPVGNKSKLRKVLTKSEYTVKDKRSRKKFKHKGIKFTLKLWKFQRKALKKLMAKGYGILKSAPRTGKTVMAAALCIRLGYKTLILAHQDDLIKQFLEHFENHEMEFTNIPDIEKFEGTKIVGIAKTVSDFKKYDICLATYQTFLSSGGKKKLSKIKNLFGTIIVDECHRSNAAGYSRIVNQFSAKHRFGLSATPERKDGIHFIARDLLGPIAHKTKAKPLTPKIKVIDTKVRPKTNYRVWTSAMRFLEREESRNKLIVKHAVRDLKRGHSLVIPVIFKSHAETLTDMINEEYGKNVAVKFTGAIPKDTRRKYILKARKAKSVRCVVAMRSMLTGVNVPAWSCIYEVMPMNNPPNFEQEILRVCTKMEGKRTPVVKMFVDEFNISRACFRSCTATLKDLRERFGGFRYTKNSYVKMRKHLDAYFLGLKRRKSQAQGSVQYNDDEDYTPTRSSHTKLKF